MMANTHAYPKKEDLEVVIGDEKQENFYPRMKIKRWDNEVNFSVGVVSEYLGKYSITDGEIEWEDEHGIKAKFYEKEDDEFEFEMELESKPSSNVLHLSIETKGLIFYYQPELTEEQIDEGWQQNDNIIGSYAVYHATKQDHVIGQNNYRNGKAFHIFRPYATDAESNRVWCNMEITDEMRIIVPQDFIDNAVYPIVIDPTFGIDPGFTGGTKISMYGANRVYGRTAISPSDAGTAQSITVLFGDYIADTHWKAMLVLSSGDTLVTNGVGDPEWVGVYSWATSSFSTNPAIQPSTSYYLMCIVDGNFSIVADIADVGSHGRYDQNNNYTTPTNLVSPQNSSRYAVYCTYTAKEGIARAKVNRGLARSGLINGGLIS